MPHKNGMWISKGFSKVITGGNGYGIYDYSVPATDGSEVSMKDFEGRLSSLSIQQRAVALLLSMNRLKRCMKSINDKGFEVLDIPCNQFAGQAPGTDEEIHDFCTLQYNTKFPQMKKSDVNGENQLAL